MRSRVLKTTVLAAVAAACGPNAAGHCGGTAEVAVAEVLVHGP